MKRWAIVREDPLSKEPVLASRLYDTKEGATEALERWVNPIGVTEIEIPSKVRPFKVGDVTKDKRGNSARIICTDKSTEGGSSIVALVVGEQGEETRCFFPDGRFYLTMSSNLDLEPMYEDA